MRRAAKIDTTARDLTTVARQMGALVWPLNGRVDALVYFRRRLWLIDWKTPHGKRRPRTLQTVSQDRMLEEGWPLHFVSTVQELTDLLLNG